MPTIAGSPSARQSQYTSAAIRTAIRMPIMMTSQWGVGRFRPAERRPWPEVSRPLGALIPAGRRARGRRIGRLGQQRVPLGDRGGDVDHGAVATAGMVAEAIEGPALVDAVALHEDALRPLDERAPLERGLETVHLLDELALLGVAADRDLDGGLDRLGVAHARVRGDPALRR